MSDLSDAVSAVVESLPAEHRSDPIAALAVDLVRRYDTAETGHAGLSRELRSVLTELAALQVTIAQGDDLAKIRDRRERRRAQSAGS